MGLFDADFASGLSAAQGNIQQNRANEQEVLMKLITAVPELMDNPDVAAAMDSAFLHNPGIVSAMGRLKGARRTQALAAQGMEFEKLKAQEDYKTGLAAERGAAAAGLPSLMTALKAVQMDGVSKEEGLQLASDTAAAVGAVKLKREDEVRELELAADIKLAQEKAKGHILGNKVLGVELGNAVRSAGAIISAGKNLTVVPELTPGAKDASEAKSAIIGNKLALEQAQLVQISYLDRIIGEDGGASPGVVNLWRQMKENEGTFHELFGEQLEEARDRAIRIGSIPEISEQILATGGAKIVNMDLLTQAEDAFQTLAAERNLPEINEAAVGTSAVLGKHLGMEVPELQDYLEEPSKEELPGRPSPYITFEELPAPLATLYLEAQDQPTLQETYKTILQMSVGDHSTAYGRMLYVRERYEDYMANGMLEPLPQTPLPLPPPAPGTP